MAHLMPLRQARLVARVTWAHTDNRIQSTPTHNLIRWTHTCINSITVAQRMANTKPKHQQATLSRTVSSGCLTSLLLLIHLVLHTLRLYGLLLGCQVVLLLLILELNLLLLSLVLGLLLHQLL